MDIRSTRARSLAVALASFVMFALDQSIKAAIVAWLGPDASTHRWELAGRYLAFEYVENRGAAFGILQGRSTLLILLAGAVAVGFALVIRQDWQADSRLHIVTALIAAGAAGNLADRIRLGYVVDFVAVGAWPKFNLADSSITIAIVLLGWTTLTADPAPAPPSRDDIT